ncbi:MAG: site-specific integrase [Desulfarculus sp.]|nr:site-specific integrase [Desulfarculus sp.]
MPKQARVKTSYPGVFYVVGRQVGTGKPERIYYIAYRRNGRLVEEKAGKQFQDAMTPARAATLRAERINGSPSNKARRETRRAKAEAEASRWTIDRLWQEYKRQRPDLKGLVTDQNRYQNHLKPAFGDKEPAQIVPLDMDRLRLNLRKTLQPATVRNALELLRRIINFGVKKHLCPAPALRIEMPKVNNLKTEDLTPDQLGRLLQAIDDDHHPHAGRVMRLALFTGLRRGEIFSLRWEDLDFERGFIQIHDPKCGQDQRIPLNKAARDLLQSLPRIDSPYVFPGRGGGKRTCMNKQFNRMKIAAGLPEDFRAMHGLRHVYASMLASSGQVDLYTLQKLLTHKSAAMTQRYAHLRDQSLRDAADLAGTMIDKAYNNTGKGIKIR